jgi:uncharacterized protein
MFFSSKPRVSALSPCIGICAVGADGLCEGCFRTLDEITRWGSLSDDERKRIMRDELPVREASRS